MRLRARRCANSVLEIASSREPNRRFDGVAKFLETAAIRLAIRFDSAITFATTTSSRSSVIPFLASLADGYQTSTR